MHVALFPPISVTMIVTGVTPAVLTKVPAAGTWVMLDEGQLSV